MSRGAPTGPSSSFFKSARAPRRVFAGFDGFVDTLYRVIRDHQGGVRNPYRDIPEFGREILARAGRSGGFELERQSLRAGGNAPLMASGLSALGVSTVCVGALGLPEPDPAFEALARAGCELVSVAPVALTTALEFGDGKLMLNDSRAFERLGWAALSAAVGVGRLRGLLEDCDLVALVGWANMPLATDLWKGLLEQALPASGGKPRKFFVDLADISRAGAPELLELMGLLRRYRAHGPVALGLNENEAFKLAGRLGLHAEAADSLEGLAPLARILRSHLDLDVVLVHPRRGACVADSHGAAVAEGRLVERPALSTGGGDHFNAGFCFAWMHGLSPAEAAGFGARVSALYVERGLSPSVGDLEAELGS